MVEFIKPIWQDYDVEISSTANTLNYEISNGQYIIYQGRANKRPDSDTIKIRLSDFAKSELNSDVNIENWDLYFMSENISAYKLPNYCKTFKIKQGVEDLSEEVAFYNSYDYNHIRDLGTAIESLSVPLNNKVLQFQFLFFTINIDERLDGEYSNEFIVQDEDGDEFYHLSLDEGDGAYLIVIGTAYMQVGKKYECYIGDNVLYKFEIVDNCNNNIPLYSLYYQNAVGGYDTYPLFSVRNVESDDVEYQTYRAFGNNTDLNNPYNRRFQSNITKKWELHTGWLTDEESKRMYHILTSHRVWLYDNMGGYTPVVITDKKVEYKTFTNEGRKKYYYTINVESANTIKKL